MSTKAKEQLQLTQATIFETLHKMELGFVPDPEGVTVEQLLEAAHAINSRVPRLSDLQAQGVGDPVAWMNPETADMVTAGRMQAWRSSENWTGKAAAKKYPVPLYTHPPADIAASVDREELEIHLTAVRELLPYVFETVLDETGSWAASVRQTIDKNLELLDRLNTDTHG